MYGECSQKVIPMSSVKCLIWWKGSQKDKSYEDREEVVNRCKNAREGCFFKLWTHKAECLGVSVMVTEFP